MSEMELYLRLIAFIVTFLGTIVNGQSGNNIIELEDGQLVGFEEMRFLAVENPHFKHYKDYFEDKNKTEFSYDPSSPIGPKRWRDHFKQCGGKQQSPIDLNLSHCFAKSMQNHLQWLHKEQNPCTIFIENDGHTAEFGFAYTSSRPMLFGGPLTSIYVFDHMHFHWAQSNKEGSEHQINSNKYAAEMHLVHRNAKYSDTQEAAKHPDGFAVIGILLKPSKEARRLRFLRYLDQIKEEDSKVVISGSPVGFSLLEIVGNLKEKFVTYAGSLTTPPCAEAVTWLVAKEPRLISISDLNQLRRLKNRKGQLLAPNHRPIQPTNSRNCLIF